jgi:hypothetical protein
MRIRFGFSRLVNIQRQLGDVRRDPPRLHPSKEGTRRSLSSLNIRTQKHLHGVTTEDNMRLLVLGLAALALSAGAASAQAPAVPVYPAYGYAPYGYGYAHGYGYYHHRYYAYYPRYHHRRHWYRY